MMSKKNEIGKKYTLTPMETWGGGRYVDPVLIEGMTPEEAKRRVDEAWADGWSPLSRWTYDGKDGTWVREMSWTKDMTKCVKLVLAEVKGESAGAGA